MQTDLFYTDERLSKVSSDCMVKYLVFSFCKMCSEQHKCDKRSFFANVTQAGIDVPSDSVTAIGNAHICNRQQWGKSWIYESTNPHNYNYVKTNMSMGNV